MTLLWVMAMLASMLSGCCSGLSSCRREHGDRVGAQSFSAFAVAFTLISIGLALLAWWWR
jgi:hypothetical protein